MLGSLVSDTPPSTSPSSWFAWSDWLGMIASIGCAIHCAAMPFVFVYLPALGLSFLADEAFHQWMVGVCFAIALTAFVPGWRKHGRILPVVVGSLGLALISIAAFGFAGDCCVACESEPTTSAASGPLLVNTASGSSASLLEVSTDGCADESVAASTPSTKSWLERLAPWLTPLGGLVLVSAHVLNRLYGCFCGCCTTDAATTVRA